MPAACEGRALAPPDDAHQARPPGRAGAGPQPRPSRAARWRAAVLVLVHVAIALHVGHWLATGESVSPLEPSEGMQLAQRGLINAGFLLFALAIASTALLGRFFCGWACHVVALQDLCRWMLLRVGIRPKAIGLGPLVAVPWIAFVYMFLAPLAWRLLAGVPLPPTHLELTTETFWETFPGPWVALATFAVCGFAIVYLLGAKGFCTYGCPYGGAFGLVDQLAPIRIRVSDACEGCGHCTAVCTSNVLVHQEVRDWGMVVDPGCMKCLDCVSVCPKDALRVGFGAPALLARRRGGTEARAPGEARRAAFARMLVLALFVPASFAVLTGFDGPLDPGLVLALSAFTLAAAAVFRGRSQRVAATSVGEDLVLASLFLAGLWTFRGWHGLVPLLFALGLAAILAWLGLLLLRLAHRRRVLLQQLVLRAEGRLTGAGRAFVASTIPAVLLGAFVAWERAADARLAGELVTRQHASVQHALAGRFSEAELGFRRVLELAPENREARVHLAGTLCELGRFREGALEYERVLELHPGDLETRRLAARAWEAAGEREAAERQREAARLLLERPR